MVRAIDRRRSTEAVWWLTVRRSGVLKGRGTGGVARGGAWREGRGAMGRGAGAWCRGRGDGEGGVRRMGVEYGARCEERGA